MTLSSRVIVALPTRNEQENIGSMIQKLKAIQLPFFVVDSHSTDATQEICNDHGVMVFQRDEYGRGYGCGIRKGLDIAAEWNYEYLGIIDCDNTYPVEAFDDLLKYIPDYDLVVGARPMSSILYFRRIGNILHSSFASLLFNKKIQDINSGMRIFSVQKFRGHLNAYHNGMVSQITCLAIRNKYRMIETPISYGLRLGNSKTKIWDAADIFKQIIKERFRKKIHEDAELFK